MKKITKYSSFIAFVLALCATVIFSCRCTTPKPDPLAGWQKDFGQPNATITKDYQGYIQKLPPDEKDYASIYGYYKDSNGQHAIVIEVALKGTVWNHVLFYDKTDKRIKAIKYRAWHYMS